MSDKSRIRAVSTKRQSGVLPAGGTRRGAEAPMQRLVALATARSAPALLRLQTTAGNRAVQRLVSASDTGAAEEELVGPAPTSTLFSVPDATLPPPGGGELIPEGLRAGMETAFGQDFSDVRVHVDNAPERVGARAYTQGSDIHFRPGEYQPGAAGGQQTIGHELAHVVQQRAGRVAAPQGLGAPVNAQPELEAEADVLGHEAAHLATKATETPERSTASPEHAASEPAQRLVAPVQRRFDEHAEEPQEEWDIRNPAPDQNVAATQIPNVVFVDEADADDDEVAFGGLNDAAAERPNIEREDINF